MPVERKPCFNPKVLLSGELKGPKFHRKTLHTNKAGLLHFLSLGSIHWGRAGAGWAGPGWSGWSEESRVKQKKKLSSKKTLIAFSQIKRAALAGSEPMGDGLESLTHLGVQLKGLASKKELQDHKKKFAAQTRKKNLPETGSFRCFKFFSKFTLIV